MKFVYAILHKPHVTLKTVIVIFIAYKQYDKQEENTRYAPCQSRKKSF